MVLLPVELRSNSFDFLSRWRSASQHCNTTLSLSLPLLTLLPSGSFQLPQLDTCLPNSQTTSTIYPPLLQKKPCSVQAAPTILPSTHQHLQLLLPPSTPSALLAWSALPCFLKPSSSAQPISSAVPRLTCPSPQYADVVLPQLPSPSTKLPHAVLPCHTSLGQPACAVRTNCLY